MIGLVLGRVDVDVRDVVQGMDALVRRGRDLRPVFRELRTPFRADLKNHFGERAGPDGAWAPYAASTLERFRRGRGNVRRRGARKGQVTKRGARRLANQLGRLKSSFIFRAGRKDLEAVSRVPWGGVHQFGGSAGRGAQIPSRTFAWVSDTFALAAATQIRDYILEVW